MLESKEKTGRSINPVSRFCLFQFLNTNFQTIETPFGVVPTLQHNGKVAGQSIAIARYLAKKVKLAGNNDWEDLEIDATVDTLHDIKISKTKYFGFLLEMF